MPTKLKTKTVIDALQSLRLIPSFTAQFSGDVLPEAILLKNILEEMLSSISILSRLEAQMANSGGEKIATVNPKLNSGLDRFAQALEDCKNSSHSSPAEPKNREGKATEQDYDADTEADARQTQSKKSRKRVLSKRSTGELITTERTSRKDAGSTSSQGPSKEELFIRSARSLLLLVQNDSSLSGLLERALEGVTVGEAFSQLEKVLEEFEAYAVSSIGVPYEARTQEIEALCGSIFMTQKFDKSIRKMQSTLDDIQESRQIQMTKKVEEKEQLQNAGEEIRDRSRTIISSIRKTVDDRVRVMAWKSHARQIKIGEVVAKFKKELNESTHEHVETETALRHENNRLESEIQSMIETYDSEMFRRHHDIDQISAKYAEEKVELEKALDDLSQVNQRKHELMEEKRLEEEEERNAELQKIRKNMAAKVIQRAFRARRTRILLKSKKKKKRKA